MRRVLRVLALSLILICPACGHGRMFRSAFTMNVRCPVCGVIFERDGGEVLGGVAINSLITSTFMFAGAFLAFFTDIPLSTLFGGLALFGIIFALLFYRHARGLWVGIIYLTGSMFED